MQRERVNDPIPVLQAERVVSVIILAETATSDQLKVCMESILHQQADFPFEIVILFFRQPDETADLCQEYAALYPEKVRFFISLKNKTDIEYIYIRSPFVVLSNGMEQWTDTEKLQKQYDFLRKNRSYSLCFHNIRYKNSDQSIAETSVEARNYKKNDIDPEYLLKYYSALFRNRNQENRYAFSLIKKERYGLFVRQITNGKIRSLSTIMSFAPDISDEDIEKIDRISSKRKWFYYL